MAEKKKATMMAPVINLPPGVPPPIFALPNGGPLVHAPVPPGAFPVPYDPYQYAYPPPSAPYAAHPPPPPPGTFPPSMPMYYPGPPPPGTYPPVPPPPHPPAVHSPHDANNGNGRRHHHHHHHSGRHHHHHNHDKVRDHERDEPRIQFIGDVESPSTTEKLLKLRNSVREQAKSFDDLAARQDELERRESKRDRKLEGVYRANKERQMADQDLNRRVRVDVEKLRKEVQDLQLEQEQQQRVDTKGRRLSVDSSDTWTTTRTRESDGTYTYIHTPYSELGCREMKDRHRDRRRSTNGGYSGKRHITIESDEPENNSPEEVYIHIRHPCKTCKEKVVIRTEKVADAATKGVVKQRLGLIIKDDDIYQSGQPEIHCDGCKARKEKEERERIYQEEKERREQKEKKIEEAVERVLEKKATTGEYFRVPAPTMPGAYPDAQYFRPDPNVARSTTMKEGPTGPRPMVQRSQSSVSPQDERRSSAKTFSSGTKVYRMPSTVVENEFGTEVNIKIPKFAEPASPPADFYVAMNGNSGGNGGGNVVGRRASNIPVPPTPARRISPPAAPAQSTGYRRASRSSASSPEDLDKTPHETVMHYHHHYHHDAPSSRRVSASTTQVDYDSEESGGSSSPTLLHNVRYEQSGQHQHPYRLGPSAENKGYFYDLPTLGQHNHHQNPSGQRRASSGASHHNHHHHHNQRNNSRPRSPIPIRHASNSNKRIASDGGPFLGQRLPEVTDNPSSTKENHNKRSFTLPESILKSKPISVPPTFVYKQDFDDNYNLEQKLEAIAAAPALKDKDEGVKVQLSPLAFNFYENNKANSSPSSSTTKVNSIPESNSSRSTPSPVSYGPDFGHKIYNVKDHQAIGLNSSTSTSTKPMEGKGAKEESRSSAKIDMNISININGKPMSTAKISTSPLPAKSTNKPPPSMFFFSHITPTPHNTPHKSQQQQQQQKQQQQRYLPERQSPPSFLLAPFSRSSLFNDEEPQFIHGRCATVEDDMSDQQYEQNPSTNHLLPPGAFPMTPTGEIKDKPPAKRVSFSSEESEEMLEGNWGRNSSKKAAKYGGRTRTREEENGWTSKGTWN